MFALLARLCGGPPRLQLTRIANQEDFRRYWASGASQSSRRRKREVRLAGNKASPFAVRAYCYPCRAKRKLLVDYQHAYSIDGRLMPNWRESLICEQCFLNNRLRAAVQLFESECRPLNGAIYLTEQVTALFRHFQQRYSHVTGSEFLGAAIPLGDIDPNGVRNENLTSLTFSDNTFDAVLSFDVLEHVPNFAGALSEIVRVLRPGGYFLFSVPFHFNLELTVIRAQSDSAGSITHFIEPEYHGDPMSPAGVLCFQNFGWDLLNRLRTSGCSQVEALMYWSEALGYLGTDQVLFLARKDRLIS